jgi:hypothetical protein
MVQRRSGLEAAVRDIVRRDPMPWLLEASSPGARYLALRDLRGLADDDPDMVAAREAAYADGPLATVLAHMKPEGYWSVAGPGYNPKYHSTVWSLVLLAQLGAECAHDARLHRACGYALEHVLLPGGQFSANNAPSGTADCLQGNLCWALLSLGCQDPRLDRAFEWMARTVTGEGIADRHDRHAPVRYYAGKCGPTFACGANNGLACAWGAVKVMLAFGRLPTRRRTPLIKRAIQHGADFLFSTDPAVADYPTGYNAKPSGNWWKFGFPVFYVTDMLQNVEALVSLGYGCDPRLAHALQLIRDKQDENGRWALDYDYAGKTWGDFGPKKAPNKWVTIRAVRVLQAAAKT